MNTYMNSENVLMKYWTYRKDIMKSLILLLIPIPIKQASLFELHKLTVTLSNLFDVTPYITSTGNSNNATLSTTPETKTTGSEAEEPISYVV